jgi:hypothetical protein
MRHLDRFGVPTQAPEVLCTQFLVPFVAVALTTPQASGAGLADSVLAPLREQAGALAPLVHGLGCRAAAPTAFSADAPAVFGTRTGA